MKSSIALFTLANVAILTGIVATIMTKGNVVKTWINGVPVARWVDNGTYPKGFFGLQIHKGAKGTVLWRDIRIKALTP